MDGIDGVEASRVATRGDPLRDALLDSRQRWRDLVGIAADLAFETDIDGRFVFLWPGTVLGWPAHALLGHASELLVPECDPLTAFNPFRAGERARNRRVWLKRPDGNLIWVAISAMPLLDESGAVTGVRGIGRDVTEDGHGEAAMAQALRRSEVIDHIVSHMRSELIASRMMKKTLQALAGTLGAGGAMIVEGCGTVPPEEMDPVEPRPPGLLHETGGDVAGVRLLAIEHLRAGFNGPGVLKGPEGHGFMLCAIPTRFEGSPGLVVWRQPGRRPWEADDLGLLAACVGTVRVGLEHGTVQQEMARQARTDSLTGLFNRRAFRDEMARRLERLTREALPGTLMFVDLDRFKELNDRLGHEAGDAALREVARLLRSVTRPGDLLARLGGDEFAVWFDGMDELAAAERAEQLRRTGPGALAEVTRQAVDLTMSIGIASRAPGSAADGSDLLRRADLAMYEAKRSGRGHWRVWRGEDEHA